MLAEKTLLKTAYHFLLLLVGFDTLTYRKDYDRSPILVGHQQAGVGLIVTDVMPIYMIMPRYSHNYAQFYQLLDSNSFTHRNTYALEISY